MKTTFYKNPLFIIGILVLAIIIAASLYVNQYVKPTPQSYWVFDNKGLIIGTNPQKPSAKHLLGTNHMGQDVVILLLKGAKFTLAAGLVVGLLRVFISLILGLLLSTIFKPLKKFLYPVVDSLHYAPAALLVYAIASPFILVYGWAFDTLIKLFFIYFSLIIVAIPSMSLFISDEIDHLRKREFIQSAKLLGGGAFHQVRNHYWPHLKTKLIILVTQHFIQLMIIFAHLGLLGLFLSGTHVGATQTTPTLGGAPRHTQVNGFSYAGNDWGGMLAEAKDDFMIHPWIIWGPCLAFTITILALTGILESFKSNYKFQRKRRVKQRKKVETPPIIADNDFVPEAKTGT